MPIDNPRLRHKTEQLFWTRSQELLRNTAGRPRAEKMARLWRECARDAAFEEASDHAVLAGVMGAIADKAGPVRASVDEYKTAPLMLAACKADTDTPGTIDGYLAVFNNVDLTKDVIEPNAFAATLHDAESFRKAHGCAALYPLLWQHDRSDPIGYIADARQDGHGLRVKCVLDLSIERGRQAYEGLKRGYLAFSIGYKPVKYIFKGSIRHLTEIALGEGSAVTFPANPSARAVYTPDAA